MSINKSKFENAVETAKKEEAAKNVTVNNAMTTETILEKFAISGSHKLHYSITKSADFSLASFQHS